MNLGTNLIGDEGAKAIGEALRVNGVRKARVIVGNNISHGGAPASRQAEARSTST